MLGLINRSTLLHSIALYFAGVAMASAATFSLLQSFTYSGGSGPEARLTQGRDGNLYGTTHTDRANNAGTVFQVTTAGEITFLHTFSGTDGSAPDAALVQGSDGNFYGISTFSSSGASAGNVFSISPSGTFAVVYAFDGAGDGGSPSAGMILAADGNFYGCTSEGGGTADAGTFYQLAPGGVFTVLHVFTSADGVGFIRAPLVQGPDGDFYGTSGAGGAHALGSVFKISPAGVVTVLYSFTGGVDGGQPSGGLVFGADGNLYGTTYNLSGPAGPGTVYKITTTGTLTTLHTFNNSDGTGPSGELVQAADGNFYGVTRADGTAPGAIHVFGTVYSISPSGLFTSVHTFLGADGGNPTAGLVLASDGNLYGTTPGGGVDGLGAVFVISFDALPAAPTGLTAAAGNAQVALNWNAVSGATSYNVYDATAAGGESTPLMSGITGTNFTVTSLVNGTAYFFKVAAVSAAGISTLSAEAVATPKAPPPPVPAQVTGLTATAAAGQVMLSWNSAANATAYTVNGGSASGQESVLTQNLTATTYKASGLTNGITYYFTVVATDAAGIGPASSEVSATPLAGVAAAPSFNPNGGTFDAAQTVTLSSSTPGAALYYTTDGTTPTTASTKYSTAIKVTATETITAITVATGYATSAAAAQTYTIKAPPVTPPPGTPPPVQSTLSGHSGGGAMLPWELAMLLALVVLRAGRASANRMRTGVALVLGLMVLVTLDGTSAQAAELDFPNAYLGVRVGSAKYATTGTDLDAALSAAGFSGTSASVRRDRTLTNIYAGVPFLGPVSLELGYVDLGRYPVTLTTASKDFSAVAATVVRALRPAGQGITLGLGAPLPLGRWFELEPHVGLLLSQSKQEVVTPIGAISDNRHDAGIAAGVGLLFRVTRSIGIGGGIDCFGAGLHCDVRAYSGTLQYRFGVAPNAP